MSIRERNRKSAIARWKNFRSRESSAISPDPVLLSRICGYLAGDGSVQKRLERNGKCHHSIEFFPDDESLIAPYVSAFESVFKKTPVIVEYPNHFRLRVFSRAIVEYLNQLCVFGLRSWTIPSSLLRGDDAKIEWLRAYFDAEAFIGKNVIRVQSVNEKGIDSVEKLLRSLSIASNRFEYAPKKNEWNKVYILVISRKEERMKFLKKIGLYHKTKRSKLSSQFDHAEVA